MKIGALVLAILFLLPYLIIAFLYPVKGMSLYLRFVGLGLFFALIYYSVNRERKGERARPKSPETQIAERMAADKRREIAASGDTTGGGASPGPDNRP